MHAMIQRYLGVGGTTEELAHAIRETASSLSRARGFVSCVVLEAEPGVLATVSIFEDLSSLEEADRLVGASLSGERGHLLSEDPQVTSGEIVFQRGL